MRLLFAGFSQIVQRRLLPAAALMPDITAIDVASSRPYVPGLVPESQRGEFFASYEEACAESKADVVYISLVNSLHAEWAERFLRAGFHVIVDKPAFTELATTHRVAELATQNGRCLAEATVYAFHPQIDVINSVFRDADSRCTRLSAMFSVPPFKDDNFRYRRELGGGALLDLGPYAVSVGRLFFGTAPDEVLGRVLARRGSDREAVDTAFSLLMTYPGGRALTGHFGFDTEYRNQLSLLGDKVAVTVDRVFTTPPAHANEIIVRQAGVERVVTAPTADAFLLFLQAVVTSIKDGKHSSWIDPLVQDAIALDSLRTSAGLQE